jgi:hypothetical protein
MKSAMVITRSAAHLIYENTLPEGRDYLAKPFNITEVIDHVKRLAA